MKNQFFICSAIMFFILFIYSNVVQAKQQMIDLTVCVAGSCNKLSEEQDWKTESCESRGIGWSNNGYKPLETFTTFAKDLLAVKDGKWNFNDLVKYLDSDGDYIIFRNNKIFGGTGKWEGVTGEIQGKWLRMGKSMPPNNYANCRTITGTFEIPE